MGQTGTRQQDSRLPLVRAGRRSTCLDRSLCAPSGRLGCVEHSIKAVAARSAAGEGRGAARAGRGDRLVCAGRPGGKRVLRIHRVTTAAGHRAEPGAPVGPRAAAPDSGSGSCPPAGAAPSLNLELLGDWTGDPVAVTGPVHSNISAANDISGSQDGSQQRQAPGYVRPQRTSAFAGERHAGLHPATSGDGPGLIHTEEVTGSIPVSPTDVRPAQRLHGQLSSYASDGSCRRIGRNLGRHLLRWLLDGQHTGRYRRDQLHNTEKTHAGTLVEIALACSLRLADGATLD